VRLRIIADRGWDASFAVPTGFRANRMTASARISLMNKRPITLIALIVCLLCTVAVAQHFHKQLSRPEKEHLLDGSFTKVATTEAMPPKVKEAFAEITGERSFALANPGQKYQETDVVYEPGLPFRRLLFAGAKDDEWFVQYERGGRGHGYDVVVFKVNAQHPVQFLWGGAGFHGAENLDELRKMVATGQFSDDRAYSW
jgi:hypothetical protein